MDCIEIDNILSTTVLYEGFFCYNDVFKFSNDSIGKLREIGNKYKKDKDTFNTDNENEIDFKNDNNSCLREVIYRFKSFISIEKLVYPLVNYDVISYEIIDLSNNNENLIIYSEEINKHSTKLEIILKNIRANHIKLRIRSRKNVWPKISEIKIVKSICE